MKSHSQGYSMRDVAPSRAQRKIPRASQGHFVGELVWGYERPQRLAFESLLEHNAALCAIYRPDFRDIREQLGPISWQLPYGRTRRHYLDFCVTRLSGERVGMSVKPYFQAQREAFRYEMQAVRAAGLGSRFDRLVVVTEHNIKPYVLANAKLFHAARLVGDEGADTLRGIFKHLQGPASIQRVLAEGQEDGLSLFHVASAIHRGHCRTLVSEKIGLDTLITADGMGQAA